MQRNQLEVEAKTMKPASKAGKPRTAFKAAEVWPGLLKANAMETCLYLPVSLKLE